VIEKYEKIDQVRGTSNGIEIAIALFGRALVDTYLKEKDEK